MENKDVKMLKEILPETEEQKETECGGSVISHLLNKKALNDYEPEEDSEEDSSAEESEPEIMDYMICIRYKRFENQDMHPTRENIAELVSALDKNDITDVNEYRCCIRCKCPMPEDTDNLMCDDCHIENERFMKSYFKNRSLLKTLFF